MSIEKPVESRAVTPSLAPSSNIERTVSVGEVFILGGKTYKLTQKKAETTRCPVVAIDCEVDIPAPINKKGSPAMGEPKQ
jgi:hypothetical protein